MKIDNKKKIAPYLFIISFSVLFFLILYKNTDLKEPLSYEGDSISVFAMIKSMINHGNWMKEELLGNGTFHLYEHNTGNTIDFLIIKIICLFTKNVFLIANLYFCLTFLLAGITAFYIFEKITAKPFVSVIFSLLFAFTPYAQLRSIDSGHLVWLGCFYIIPVSVWACLSIMEDKKINHINILLFLIGLSNIYYSYFSALLLLAVCVGKWIQDKNWDRVKRYVRYLGVLITAIIINLSPSIWFYITNQSNTSGGVFQRLPQMAEVFGLKTITLLLPRLNHRWGFFSWIHDNYTAMTGTNMETEVASLGMIGSVGFICLLVVFCLRIKIKNTYMTDLAYLNGLTLIISVIGGIGNIAAYIIPMIRCYARMSIFIAFFSMAWMALLCAEIQNKIKKNKPIFYALLAVILCVGLWDQTETFPKERQAAIVERKNADNVFLKTVLQEKKNSKIYQYPGETYPGGGYEYMKWYILDDSSATWSSGGMLGRKEGYWINRMEKLDSLHFLEQLKLNGFDGIFINYFMSVTKYGADKTDAFIKDILEFTEEDAIYNETRDHVFIDLDNNSYKNLKVSKTALLVYPVYKNGIEDEVITDEGYQRFVGNNAEIVVENDTSERKNIIFCFDSACSSELMFNKKVDVYLNGNKVDTIVFKDNFEEQKISIPLVVQAGESVIELKTDVNTDKLLEPYKNRLYYLKNDVFMDSYLEG